MGSVEFRPLKYRKGEFFMSTKIGILGYGNLARGVECASINICIMLRNARVRIKTIHNIKILCILRCLFWQVGRTAPTQDHHIKAIYGSGRRGIKFGARRKKSRTYRKTKAYKGMLCST